MVSRNGIRFLVLVCAGQLLAAPALATFHLMQIEQVIGGVDGDTAKQAIQLRMLAAGQNLLAGSARVCVYDAAGANLIVLTTFPFPDPVSGGCVRILIASPGFSGATFPPVDAPPATT